VRGVSKVFEDGTRALDLVDLHVDAGELVGIGGPSGSGKSTLLSLLAALDRPSAGTIEVAGWSLDRRHAMSAYRRRVVGVVFQLHNLLPHLTARQNIEIAMLGTHVGAHERGRRADELLERVDLADRAGAVPPTLSGGERQRVAIARALANRPRVLLADEPTGNLDPDSIALVVGLMADTRRDEGTTVVVVTHDDRVARATDRMLTLVDGRIVPSRAPTP
jgi:ABC-type lipoprotein export system ATPase subunit